MSELSIHDLETQTGELLPEREALGIYTALGSFNTHVTHVVAINSSEAVQALALGSSNNAVSLQSVVVG
jgi:hypothetical protein